MISFLGCQAWGNMVACDEEIDLRVLSNLFIIEKICKWELLGECLNKL